MPSMLTTSSFMRNSRKKAPSALSMNLRASLAAPVDPCTCDLGWLGPAWQHSWHCHPPPPGACWHQRCGAWQAAQLRASGGLW